VKSVFVSKDNMKFNFSIHEWKLKVRPWVDENMQVQVSMTLAAVFKILRCDLSTEVRSYNEEQFQRLDEILRNKSEVKRYSIPEE